jgi:hypothetical protein
VPANVTALILKEGSDAEKFTCRARSFPPKEGFPNRGILSYHASETLGRVDTVAAWLRAIHAASVSGLSARLGPLYQPTLQVWGDGAIRLPGQATTPVE